MLLEVQKESLAETLFNCTPISSKQTWVKCLVPGQRSRRQVRRYGPLCRMVAPIHTLHNGYSLIRKEKLPFARHGRMVEFEARYRLALIRASVHFFLYHLSQDAHMRWLQHGNAVTGHAACDNLGGPRCPTHR